MTSTPATLAAAAPYLNPTSEAELFDSSGVIAIDLPCRGCEYNLRGLPRDSRCPECGIPSGLSTHGDLLRFADPAWLRKLARGISYMLWGILVAVVVSVAGGTLGAGTSPVAAGLVGLLASLLAVYGAWLVTERDPSGLGEERYGRARRIIRFTLLASVGSRLLEVIAIAVAPTPLVFALLVLMGFVCALIGLVGEYCKLIYFEKLALRIPNYNLSKFARVLRRWLVGVWGLMLVVGMAGAIIAVATAGTLRTGVGVTVRGGTVVVQTPSGTTTPAPATAPTGVVAPGPATPPPAPTGVARLGLAASLIGVVVGIGFLIVMIAYIRLLLRLGRAFREQERHARAAWDAALGSA